jgi:hypothetical protein
LRSWLRSVSLISVKRRPDGGLLAIQLGFRTGLIPCAREPTGITLLDSAQ